MARRLRLDRLLVERGLFNSREKAQAWIMAGEVLIDGQKAGKPGMMVADDVAVEVLSRPRYVSRGGLKLEAALTHFGVDPNGKICMDIGTSTGGFTDCLLQHGAVRVHAVDTGAGQIDWKLRGDARVVLHENTNARYITIETTGELADLLTCDVSFISVTLILPAIAQLLRPGGEIILLIKPQFEVGKEHVGSGGIVRDAALREAACARVQKAVEELGFETRIIESPITGAEGNVEFLLHAAPRK
jgi:23S rRNA (cytidine1920-2'-O)/16S rRNA (cytidine1409-2'-O)-methyltransferase